MVWFILSIFVAFGILLLGIGYANIGFISPSASLNLGALIILASIWVGYRAWCKKNNISGEHKKLFAYLDVLYNNTGLFVKQYYDSDDSHNSQKSKSLHAKMERFVPLMSRYKLSLPGKLITEINTLFDMLFQYKVRVEGAVSFKRDETAYKRWLEINVEFGEKVAPKLEGIKNDLRK